MIFIYFVRFIYLYFLSTIVLIISIKLNKQLKDAELADLLIRRKPKFAPEAPKCAKCLKNVYKAEETRAANKTYHKLCFKCTSCNKLLEPKILTEHSGELYCKNCYAKNFGPKGYGVGVASLTSNDSLLLPTSSTTGGQQHNPTIISSTTTPIEGGGLKWTFSSLQQQQPPQQTSSLLAQTKTGIFK